MMRWTKLPIRFLAALLVILLAGCAGIQKSYPDKRYFALEAPRSVRTTSPASAAVIRLRHFRVTPAYEGKELVYRTGDLTYQSDFYNEFFIFPTAMMMEATRSWLDDSGLFQYVVDAPSQVMPDYTLEGVLTALYGDYRDQQAPKAVLGLQFLITSGRESRPEIVFHSEYRREVPLNNGRPETLVAGWNEALSRILSDFEADLRSRTLK